ncbi:MAG: proline--tRNA ligase [Cyanobacteria bacterium MAG CAR1_bin_15]|nr:proline--tRNA ligase [Cyanobacteria bacterium MAG CAR1_bin_15]
MRAQDLLLVTLREPPAEAEIPSHQWLVRGGFIRRIASGIYAYMPLMWRVLRKVEAIVREEMDAIGALELRLPALQPAELWRRSGRWDTYTAGEGIMFSLRDRQGRELGLGPTHEEVVTSLAADLIRSYRQLPVCFYQLQTKFRDEIRPRFGLMRGREFIMKDAYSFHADEEDLRRYYGSMDQAYRRVFARCGLKVLAVQADSGAIGGAASQEFMAMAEAGEDLVLSSADGRYAANQERAQSLPPPAAPLKVTADECFATPGQATIEAVCAAHNLHPTQTVKVLLHRASFADGPDQPVLTVLRGDQEVNTVKLANVLGRLLAERGPLLALERLEVDTLPAHGAQLPVGFLGPDLADDAVQGTPGLVGGFLRIVDPTAADLAGFVCGANAPDQHRRAPGWRALALSFTRADVRSAQPGDRCRHDSEAVLTATRGIEVGHIFQLGRKYSSALAACFNTEGGGTEPMWMGCYGIGVSRLAQAAVEQNHDDNGMIWPVGIAPFEVVITVANGEEQEQRRLAEGLYGELRAAGVDVLLDDRVERAGVKFKDADLLGIPWRVVVGRNAARGGIELKARSAREVLDMDAPRLLPHLLPRLQRQRRGSLPETGSGVEV